VEYRDLARLLLNPRIETELLPGVGKAYGAELFLKRTSGQYNGWLSYTYSRTLRRVDGGTPGERVNQGDWFPANFDQPHTLNLVFNAKVNRRNRFSANFTYLTGRPVTAPVTAYLVNGLYVPHYSERNQFRIPDYHRLDVSYTLNTSPFRRQKYTGSFTFSVYNVYSRRNAYSVFFQRNPELGANAFKLSVLGSAFPAATYNFSF
jgi:ferric enterobactin receptor